MTNKDQLARSVYNKMMEKDYCTQWLDATPVFVKEGHCKLKMTVRKEMLNGYGILHGGIAFTFADSAFAFASNSRGRHAVSIETSISHVAALQVGDVILAINNSAVKSVQSFNNDLRKIPKGKTVALLVYRNGDTLYVPVKITD